MRWQFRDPREWRSFFAWQPYLVDGKWIWLERIERRATFIHMYGELYEYRLPRDSGRHAQRGDANAAPSEGCQSGGATSAASPIPTPPNHPSNREAT